MKLATRSNVKPTQYPCYIGVQIVERAYGGPEEGGWYYDASTEYTNVVKIYDEHQFDQFTERLCADYHLKTWSGSTLAPNRQDGATFTRLWFGTKWPENRRQNRPQYE